MEHYTETASKAAQYGYNDLSPLAKKLLKKCYSSTLSIPLQFCRIMQEDATGAKYLALNEVELYLINE